MRKSRWRVLVLAGATSAACAAAAITVSAWGAQGHRLVARVAENNLSTVARQNVRWLLDNATLADVSTWADQFDDGMRQTSSWHYVNIPRTASSYDRNRDCPRQPGVAAGSRADRWRDCVVDRILYNEERLADATLDRADRAIALKFLVHFVGDIHQPFHAMGEGRGGNDIDVSAFGSTNCSIGDGSLPCNLHGVWDSTLLSRRRMSDAQYLDLLADRIKERTLNTQAGGAPADWARESHALARAALVADGGAIDEAYYRAQIPIVEDRLALGGLRLAGLLNRVLTTPK